jgi:3-isopropylmalate dehydrogenase
MMKTTLNVAVLNGDGIGPEVVEQGVCVLKTVADLASITLNLESALFGGASIDDCGVPISRATLDLARSADAALLGAVGGPKWDGLRGNRRPERGLLELRQTLAVYANLRPVKLYAPLIDASPLRPERAKVDFVVVRELLGDVYFGLPRGIWDECESRKAVNTMVYTDTEIRRIGVVAFELARQRKKKLLSVDKANVLESHALWRDVMSELGGDYPDIDLSHMYIDNCAMQFILDPSRFDVVVAGNLFGDILSDEAAALTGSIGMLPSASLGGGSALYEPIHGSAPDIVGTGKANPIATILSVGLLFEHTAGRPDLGRLVESAVETVLSQGLRTADLMAGSKGTPVSGRQMGEAIVEEIKKASQAAPAKRRARS